MFNSYFLDSVVLVEKSGSSSWGEKTETEITVKARVEYKNKLVRNSAGEQVVSAAMVYMRDRTLSPGSRIKIDGVEHSILNVVKHRSFRNNAMLEVQVG